MSLAGKHIILNFPLSIKLDSQSIGRALFLLTAHVQWILSNVNLWKRTTISIILKQENLITTVDAKVFLIIKSCKFLYFTRNSSSNQYKRKIKMSSTQVYRVGLYMSTLVKYKLIKNFTINVTIKFINNLLLALLVPIPYAGRMEELWGQ